MIIPYTSIHQPKLLEILRLNTPAFFDASEEDSFIAYLNNEIEHYFVVEQAGQIVGAGGFNFVEEGKIARISWDLFHPSVQGKGLGKALIYYRIEQIQQNLRAEIICVRTSQLVYQFYEKIGFELTEIVKDYWAVGYDLYYMEWGGRTL